MGRNGIITTLADPDVLSGANSGLSVDDLALTSFNLSISGTSGCPRANWVVLMIW